MQYSSLLLDRFNIYTKYFDKTYNTGGACVHTYSLTCHCCIIVVSIEMAFHDLYQQFPEVLGVCQVGIPQGSYYTVTETCIPYKYIHIAGTNNLLIQSSLKSCDPVVHDIIMTSYYVYTYSILNPSSSPWQAVKYKSHMHTRTHTHRPVYNGCIHLLGIPIPQEQQKYLIIYKYINTHNYHTLTLYNFSLHINTI